MVLSFIMFVSRQQKFVLEICPFLNFDACTVYEISAKVKDIAKCKHLAPTYLMFFTKIAR